ncbi:hypothetical protein PR048_001081 [Dryococelus australis]|uniref:Uncharacterized protein n=1 Tax=Dryococelus australis TaxID=614101 RepID=A0ABQ9IGC7_9NEOP|nr:hypothetical protein PR048_001081 [Dryococelus australis]
MDNVDFCEDTIDGRTFHGTAVTVYQDIREYDRNAPISLVSSENMPLTSLQDALLNILSCTKPPNWNTCPEPVVSTIVPQYGVKLNNAIWCDEVWFLLRQSLLNDDSTTISFPTRIGYNSHLGELKKAVEPVFKLVCSFMDMVQFMLYFIRAVRTSDWNLSLAYHDFLKYLFSLNRLNYSRMISLYLTEMDVFESTDPAIWKNFMEGKWVVNCNVVPFCALGADEALEHQNRRLKVQGGPVGITLNDSARNRFFLVNPQLNRISIKTEALLGTKTFGQTKHHGLLVTAQKRQDCNVSKLKEAFENSRVGPFQCKNKEITHILTQRVFPQDEQDFVGYIVELHVLPTSSLSTMYLSHVWTKVYRNVCEGDTELCDSSKEIEDDSADEMTESSIESEEEFGDEDYH